MADTLPAITSIEDEWIDVYSFVGVDVGIPLVIQNTGSTTLLLRVQENQPNQEQQGRHLYPLVKETLNAGNSGLWVKNSPKSTGLSRLQVDIAGGLDETGVGTNLVPNRVQVQIEPDVLDPNTTNYILIKNNSLSPLQLDQIINAEAFATGANEGSSVVSLLAYFNVNLTGSTPSVSSSRAYVNDFAGNITNITGSLIEFQNLTGFNESANPDFVRLLGGDVFYNQSNQALNIGSFNKDLLFKNPLALGAGDSAVLSFRNSALVSGGTQVLATAYISGLFLNFSGIPVVEPDNLTYEGDQLTYESDNLTYGE